MGGSARLWAIVLICGCGVTFVGVGGRFWAGGHCLLAWGVVCGQGGIVCGHEESFMGVGSCLWAGGVICECGESFVGRGCRLWVGDIVCGCGASSSLKQVEWLMCGQYRSFVGIINDPGWGVDAHGWWSHCS